MIVAVEDEALVVVEDEAIVVVENEAIVIAENEAPAGRPTGRLVFFFLFFSFFCFFDFSKIRKIGNPKVCIFEFFGFPEFRFPKIRKIWKYEHLDCQVSGFSCFRKSG